MDSNDFVSVSGNSETPKAATEVVAEPKEIVEAAAPVSEEVHDEQLSDETTDDSGTSEENEEEVSPDESAESKDQPKRKGGVQKKIDKLTRRLGEKDSRIAQLEAQLQSSSQQAKPVEQKVEPKAQAHAVEGEPNPDDFETVKDYFKAVAKFELEQDRKAEKEQKAKTEAQAAKDKVIEAHKSRLDEFVKSQPEWESVRRDFFEDYGDFALPDQIQETILESENGPVLLFHLMKNPNELESLMRLSGRPLDKALAKLQVTLEASSQTPSPKQEVQKTAAPAPINPVGKSVGSSSKKTPENMDVDEYMEWRRKNR